jgi:8-oxo-dGTP diphosphatase
MGRYDPMEFPPAAITVDLVVLTIRRDELAVLLIHRGVQPYLGRLALPGGFVRPDESLDAAAARELQEETGLALGWTRPGRTEPPVAAHAGTAHASTAHASTAPATAKNVSTTHTTANTASTTHASTQQVHLEQLASYGDPGRDPRLHVVTVAYLALAPELPEPRAGSDAAAASWVPVNSLGSGLAFDHDQILGDGLERARAKLEYTPLATAFCPAEFTVGRLRRVYEIVWGTIIDPRNFHRKVTGTAGFLADTGSSTWGERGRPAQLYRRGDATVLYPPMLRTSVSVGSAVS